MSAPLSLPEDLAALLTEFSARGPLQFHPLPATADWDATFRSLAYQPVGYSGSHVGYQHTYFAEFSAAYQRLDCLLFWQGRPVGLWPLSLRVASSGLAGLSSQCNGQPGIVPPLLPAELPDRVRKGAARQWLGLVAQLARLRNVAQLEFVAPAGAAALESWHRLLLEHGAATTVRVQARIDLSLAEADYHAGLRKSFKALINSARREWSATLDQSGDPSAFAEFEAFHIEVAGRRTRSAASWADQFSAICDGSAYAIYLRDPAGRLVGASLINCSRDEALYAIGAYDRQLFDKPLAHLSLAEAIACARRRGLRRFILGDRPYPGSLPPPSDKELTIGYFKEGFASELVLVPYLTLTADCLGTLAG